MKSSSASEKKDKILVYLIGSLGDTIVTIPAMRSVRRHFPDAEIVILQNTQAGGLVPASEVVPRDLFDRSLSYESDLKGADKAIGYFRLLVKLWQERFDTVIYLAPSERPSASVNRDKTFFRVCGITRLLGFHSFSKEELYPSEPSGHPAVTDHEAMRKLIRLERDGIEVSLASDLRTPFFRFSEDELKEVKDLLIPLKKDPDSPVMAIGPGSKTSANLWPVTNFIDLAGKVAATFDHEIVIVGGPAEAGIGDEIVKSLGFGINLAGRFSVRESAAFLSMCDLYLGVDSGTSHLAAAAGTRCFSIHHERDNPGQWFPLGAGHSVIYHRVECAGCGLNECPVPGHPCMTGMTPEIVWCRLQTFVDKSAMSDEGWICKASEV
ncbi:MAG: glycosyltransferase family 9 protein [Pyrinomonadaceae bacterium]